ncbi:MAG: hypothetical protein ACI4TM_01175 [Candidatus Cryptobacteroides sp.]
MKKLTASYLDKIFEDRLVFNENQKEKRKEIREGMHLFVDME